jgi:hypothetical protein
METVRTGAVKPRSRTLRESLRRLGRKQRELARLGDEAAF